MSSSKQSFTLLSSQAEELFAHARACEPEECCGLIGGVGEEAKNIYPLRNTAANPLNAYEAAVEDLFEAQRLMREREQALLAIYHSHPRSSNPTPSETDIALAYYPSAVYIIIGFDNDAPVLRAFRIYESERRWEEINIRVIEN